MGNMMNSVGVTPANLFQKWQWGLEIDGFTAAYFTKCSIPEIEQEEVKFSPGGSIFDQKVAGRISFKNITVEAGQPVDSSGDEFMDWMGTCVDTVNNTGGVPADYLRDLDVVQYDRSGNEIKRWRLHDAFPKTFKGGDLEGGSSDNVIRSSEICYNWFEII